MTNILHSKEDIKAWHLWLHKTGLTAVVKFHAAQPEDGKSFYHARLKFQDHKGTVSVFDYDWPERSSTVIGKNLKADRHWPLHGGANGWGSTLQEAEDSLIKDIYGRPILLKYKFNKDKDKIIEGFELDK